VGQPVVHFEVQGTDREALALFYQQLFDWKTNDIAELSYTMVETAGDGGINGGIGPTPEGAPGGVHVLRALRRCRRLVEARGGAGRTRRRGPDGHARRTQVGAAC
jgi:predicted enzyme related to lactoylglutathione lyase